MLELFIWIFLLCTNRIIECEDYFSIYTKGSDVLCATNSSYGLSWISHREQWIPEAVSEFVLKSDISKYDCDIGVESENCNQNWTNELWKIKSWNFSDDNELILDRRWEKFEQILLPSNGTNDKYIVFQRIASGIESNKFKLSISIRFPTNLFLCDDSNHTHCYWIAIQKKNGVKRECFKTYADRYDKDLSFLEMCELNNTRNISHYSLEWDEQMWIHLEISRDVDKMILETTPEALMEPLALDANNINVSAVSIFNTAGDGFLKIHKYQYLMTNELQTNLQIGPEMEIDDGKKKVCFSMFLKMCKSCVFNVMIKDKENKKLFDRNFTGNTWIDEQHCTDQYVSSTKIMIYVSTIIVKGRDDLQVDQFWAIDDVKFFRNDEKNVARADRIIRWNFPEDPFGCQLVSEISVKTYNAIDQPRHWDVTSDSTTNEGIDWYSETEVLHSETITIKPQSRGHWNILNVTTVSVNDYTFIPSRYVSFTIFLVVLLIVIIVLALQKWKPLKNERRHRGGRRTREYISLISTTSKPNEYQDIQSLNSDRISCTSKRIKTSELDQYVKNGLSSGEIEQQYNMECKLHFKDPFTSRYGVIDGYKSTNAYVWMEPPTNLNLEDFWSIVLREDIKGIVNLDSICENEKYWYGPVKCIIKFGNIEINNLSNSRCVSYDVSKLEIKSKNETRTINHWHFNAWPVPGTPSLQDFVSFLRQILKIPINSENKFLIVTSDCGRAGTVILCDICWRTSAYEGYVDFLKSLNKLRKQRANIINNIEYYKLAHLVVLELIFGIDTLVSCEEFVDEFDDLKKSEDIMFEMSYLQRSIWYNTALSNGYEEPVFKIWGKKNRFSNIIPGEGDRIILPYHQLNDASSCYINAVNVDSYKLPKKFIVTQQPLPHTLGDFWRLVKHYEIRLLINLNDIDPKDKTSCFFWPDERGNFMRPVDFITLKTIEKKTLKKYDMFTVEMSCSADVNLRYITILTMKNWTSMETSPNSIDDFLDFWVEYDEVIMMKSEKVLVTCYDGVAASGVFVALSFIIDQIKHSGFFDVCQAVRSVRSTRNEFITGEAQLSLLYDLVLKYLKNHHIYWNIEIDGNV